MWPTARRARRALLPQVIELLAIVAFLVAAYNLTIWGWAQTAPKEVTVPKIVGLQQQEATGLLKSLGLDSEVISEKASEDTPEGKVLEAEPGAGRVVKVGRKVRLTISSGSRWAKVPDVGDMSVDRARALLKEARLVVKREKARYDPKVPVGYVLGQTPTPGGKVPRGTEVDLLVSKGPEPDTEVIEDQPSDSGTHSRTIELTVPPGASLQEVKIIVTDTSGEHVAYHEYHEPGETISQTVSGEGANAVARVYLSGLLVQEKALNPKH
ncbi:MAG: PASTA domain-containing protein [Armatimonadota bacterium]|jgi:serine/threonine-protein kinase